MITLLALMGLVFGLMVVGLMFVVIATLFKVAFKVAFIPLKIVGVLVCGLLSLVVIVPLALVALPVLGIVLPLVLVACVIALPLLIVGALFCGGLGLVFG